ncbi:hypothetical protein PR001_g24384 [Phytophthora rubi]|uniref:Uncharacterized protein n=1 Tax=Phytophthora rubi TaxID=129364 RepID=A0A6A3ICF9_9STRA|nr:hypothetical protein PR002_g25200 [Phytophthora rubi]KAE8980030.1 hypothetical protein PR001_g24384 [Phytophthora rubi]
MQIETRVAALLGLLLFVLNLVIIRREALHLYADESPVQYPKPSELERQTPTLQSLQPWDVAADSLADAAAVSGAGSIQVTGSDDSAAVDDTVAVLARFVGLLLEMVLLGRLLFLDMMMFPLSE